MKRFLASLLGAFFFWYAAPVAAQTNQAAGLTPCSIGVSISVSNVSSNSQLSTCGQVAVVWNTGSTTAFFNWGTASNTAATVSGWVLPAGTAITLNTGRAGLYLAAITAASTTTLQIVQGNGTPTIAGGSGGGGTGNAAAGATGAAVPSSADYQGVNIGGNLTGVQGATAGADNVSNTITGAYAYTRPSWFNGATWDRAMGDVTNGLWVNVKAVAASPLTMFFLQPAASDNHTVIKNGSGTVYKITVTNNSATVNYIRLYNAGTGFNGCNSATNLIYQAAIPASTSVGGLSDSWVQGMAGFTSGISLCVTSGYATTDTTNATASAMSLNIGYQ
jgi:hypothetical protein